VNGLLLVGASGLAREVMSVVSLRHARLPVNIVDDDSATWGTLHGLTPVLGAVDLVGELVDHGVVVTVGHGTTRRRLVSRLEGLRLDPQRFTSLVHPRVMVTHGSTIGAGSIVLDSVVLTADAVVGRHVVLMPHVTLTHGCTVGDFATLCAGVSLGGDVEVGEAAYIGMNASVRERVRIGPGATVGMGAVVLQDVPAGETWAGVPARPIRTGVLT
jgi:sugar O-acyltransferase (sialic acid O-acetyltransferase NeuD family)